jgi:hypothetical protein
MTEPNDPLDTTFSRLSAATAGIRPSIGFNDRVLLALTSIHVPEWGDGILKFGKTVLVVAALSAVTATIVGLKSQRAETEAFASTYATEDFDW